MGFQLGNLGCCQFYLTLITFLNRIVYAIKILKAVPSLKVVTYILLKFLQLCDEHEKIEEKSTESSNDLSSYSGIGLNVFQKLFEIVNCMIKI